ncbi:MFS transporter [Actinokineospora auranticolor]|uniref:Putative MFS family arabinose efflux permease n=1 Tax=Actinokineospora auranticolor TaxID=155976 RepID=A0A2S6GPF7_9PSEU|nr:MFS transporter [Actinokineospora auranticolor]PPK67011.1 putative MFS family arabinose efflux permease [Actinokineospora auranticolor]
MITVLRQKAFGRLWLSYTASAVATGLLPTALILAILDRHNGFTALGLVLGARTLGFLIGALPAGVIADRYPRAKALACSSLLRAAGAAAVALLLDLPTIALCAAVFLAGAGEGVFRSAYQALVGELVAEEHRHEANAATTLSLRVCLVAGPTAAVALHSGLGRTTSLLIAAALWLVSTALVAPLARGDRKPPETNETSRNALADFGHGLREARRHRWFLAGLAALIFWLALGEAAKYLMLPIIARDRFGGDWLIGAALGAYSLGAVGAAVLMSRWRPRRPGIPAMIMLGSYGLVPLSLAFAHHSWIIIACCAVGGAGIEIFNIPWFTAIQREVPQHLQARVSALDFLVSYGMSPLGLALLPAIIADVGGTTTLTVCGLLVIAAALLTLLVPGMATFTDPHHPKAPHTTPTPQAAEQK